MSTNNHAALRSIKARVTPMIMGTAATGSRVALSRWARPSKAARHAAPPTAVASEVKPILSWNSSSSKPKPSVEAVADATSPPSADSEPDHLAHAKPIDFDMASKIEGQESQMVSFELEPGQVIRVRTRRTALSFPCHFVAVAVNSSGRMCRWSYDVLIGSCCTVRYRPPLVFRVRVL